MYASFYEGFGIPIFEGFESGIPVITSQGGVFPETGRDAPGMWIRTIRTRCSTHSG
ncbi:MAG: hypothetical protein LUD68_00145 [Rikenellaceae bacterium]|nr:hypothetical protein [Rikenellaceae bacterium]